jgi:hypothetical protein
VGVTDFGEQVAELGWVTDLLVAGSLATGDYVPGISDIDLVALTDGPVDADRQTKLVEIHQAQDPALKLGCVYVNAAQVSDTALKHPTWTHQRLIQRILSGVNRAELVRHGQAVFGREPREVLPAMSDDDVREAGRAELTGYWAWAARRPRLWLDPEFADLSLTSMARGRHAIATGTLLTKSAAIEQAAAPAWLIEQLRARRSGAPVTSPRYRTAVIAWLDAWRTTRRAAPRPAGGDRRG